MHPAITLFFERLFGTPFRAVVTPFHRSFYCQRVKQGEIYKIMKVTHLREQSLFRGCAYLGQDESVVLVRPGGRVETLIGATVGVAQVLHLVSIVKPSVGGLCR